MDMPCLGWFSEIFCGCMCSQLLPCGHRPITDTPIIRTGAKSLAKTDYRHLTEIKSCCYELSLMRTLTQGPHSVRSKGSSLYVARPDLSQVSESCMNLSENRVFFSFTKFSQSNNGQWAVTPSTNTSRWVTVDSIMSLSDAYFVKCSKAKGSALQCCTTP